MRSLLHIDPRHNAAIRAEIGERLRIILGLSRPQKVPVDIRQPLDCLAERDSQIDMKPSAIVQSPNKSWLRRLLGRGRPA
jgi:hypothetical protein